MEAKKKLIEEWLPLKEVNFDVDIEMAFKFSSREYHGKVKVVEEVEVVRYLVEKDEWKRVAKEVA